VRMDDGSLGMDGDGLSSVLRVRRRERKARRRELRVYVREGRPVSPSRTVLEYTPRIIFKASSGAFKAGEQGVVEMQEGGGVEKDGVEERFVDVEAGGEGNVGVGVEVCVFVKSGTYLVATDGHLTIPGAALREGHT